jgi:hypothetical protein
VIVNVPPALCVISFSVWGTCLESPSPGLAQVNSVPSEALDHAHNTINIANMSDRLPRTPPEVLAGLEQAKANAQIHNRFYNEAGAYIQDQNNRGQPTATDKACNELVDAHGTIRIRWEYQTG